MGVTECVAAAVTLLELETVASGECVAVSDDVDAGVAAEEELEEGDAELLPDDERDGVLGGEWDNEGTAERVPEPDRVRVRVAVLAADDVAVTDMEPLALLLEDADTDAVRDGVLTGEVVAAADWDADAEDVAEETAETEAGGVAVFDLDGVLGGE